MLIQNINFPPFSVRKPIPTKRKIFFIPGKMNLIQAPGSVTSICILINLCYKKKRFDGQIMLMYVSWYGLGRMFIELLRTDSLTNGGWLRVSSLVGLLSFVIGGGLLLFFFIKNKGRKAFTPVSATASETNGESAEATIDEDSATEDAATENSECSDGNLSEQEAQEENQESQPKETQETQENTNNSEENKNGNID